MPELTRRAMVTGMSSLGFGAVAATAAGNAAADAAIVRELKLDDPANNLAAYLKLRGDLADEPVYDIARGSVFGLVPGEPARPLFKMIGAQRSVYARVSALEYRAETRYVGILLDWQSEQPLRQWLNPYNEKLCAVPVTRYGPTTMRLLTDRMVPASGGPESPPRTTRPWFVMGGIVHMTDQITSPVLPALQPDTDLMRFAGDGRLLADPGATRVPSQLSFTAVEAWREWMQMQQTGSLWWHVAGVKLAGPSDYPHEFVGQLRRQDPEFFAGDDA